MKGIHIIRKKEGETPLEALEAFRTKKRWGKDVKMTYAGRLDPLVSGLLVILSGDLTKQKEKYLKLSKEYAFSVLFGFSTDTHDILGKVTSGYKKEITENVLKIKIKENLKFFTGDSEQEYPLYSSKMLKSTRGGKKAKPITHMVSVKSLKFLKLKKITGTALLQNIERRIIKVNGDFRQGQILKKWRKILAGKKSTRFFVAFFYIKCGSGTYVRKIAHDLGSKISIPALALTIERTKIGKWGKAG